MPLYAYKAMDAGGRIRQGRMDAVNEIDLEMRLRRMELDFINGAPQSQHALFAGRIPRHELINFTFHLEQLVKVGVPILEGLADLRDSVEHPRFREIIATMIESIEGGQTLSQAMEYHPSAFDDVFRSLVRSGELSGNLAEVLRSLFEALKWQDELAAHTKKLLMYPAFMGAVVIAVFFFMMLYLVPQLTGFIKSVGHEIPLHTKALIAVSNAFVHYWYLIISLPLVAAIVFNQRLKTDARLRYRFDAFKLGVPVIGDIMRKIVLSRFASTFAMMYASGIGVIDTIRTTERVVGNAVIQDGIRRAAALIEEGQNVTQAFQGIGLFPPLVIRMLRVGENTGSLDTALINVAYFYNRDVKESIGRLQTLIEPMMTIIVGVLLGWIMISVLGPIYDVITKMKT